MTVCIFGMYVWHIHVRMCVLLYALHVLYVYLCVCSLKEMDTPDATRIKEIEDMLEGLVFVF